MRRPKGKNRRAIAEYSIVFPFLSYFVISFRPDHPSDRKSNSPCAIFQSVLFYIFAINCPFLIKKSYNFILKLAEMRKIIPFLLLASFVLGTLQNLAPVYPRTMNLGNVRDGDEEEVGNDDMGREIQCGMTKHHKTILRIEHGQQSPVNDWPWASSVRVECETKNNKKIVLQTCTGALISDKWLITAAHCLFVAANTFLQCKGNGELLGMLEEGTNIIVSSQFVKVTVGGEDWNRTVGLGIQSYIKHENFTKKSDFGYDIALIEAPFPGEPRFDGTLNAVYPLNFNLPLKTPLVLDWHANRICLPSVYSTRNGHSAYMLGYGNTRGARENKMTQLGPSSILREDLITLRSSHPCPRTMLCNVPGASRHTAPGDSGGPLMRESNGKWYIVGITKGHSCQQRSCFTRVTPFCAWISAKTKNEAKCFGVIH